MYLPRKGSGHNHHMPPLVIAERLLDVLSLVLAKQPYKVPGAQAPQPRAPAPAPDKTIVLVRHA
jgi:hypothetical protein